MRLPFFSKIFKKKGTDEYLLALDLGSTEVKATIYRAPSEFEGTKFMGIGVQRQGATSMLGGRIQDLDAVIETVNLAIDEAQLQAGHSASQTVLGLSGGILYAKGLLVRTRRAEPSEIVTEEEFNKVATQIEEKTLEKAKLDLGAKFNTEFQRVETSFTAYQIDGAKVRTPIGLSGGNLEVAVLHYFAEREYINTVESLAQELGLEIISLVDTAINLAISRIDQYFSSVLIDIGGDVTEIVVVKSGKVVGQELLFWGGKDFTNQIVHDLSMTHDEAESLKLDFASGHLDYERAQEIEKVLDKNIGWWVDGVAATLKAMELDAMPDQFLVAGQSRHLSSLKSALMSYPWDQSLAFVNPPKIEIIGGSQPGLRALTEIEI